MPYYSSILLFLIPYILASFIWFYCVKFFSTNVERAFLLNPILEKRFKILCFILPTVYYIIMKIFSQLMWELYLLLLAISLSIWLLGAIIWIKLILETTLNKVGGVWGIISLYLIWTLIWYLMLLKVIWYIIMVIIF